MNKQERLLTVISELQKIERKLNELKRLFPEETNIKEFNDIRYAIADTQEYLKND
jgi:DNA repair ATPase RecN